MDIKEANPPSINLNQLNLQLKNLYTETLSIYQKCQQKQDGKCKEIYQNLLKKYKHLHLLKNNFVLQYNLDYTPFQNPNSLKKSKSLNKYIHARDSFSKILNSN